MGDMDYNSDGFGQIIAISGIVAGFAYAIAAQLVTQNDQRSDSRRVTTVMLIMSISGSVVLATTIAMGLTVVFLESFKVAHLPGVEWMGAIFRTIRAY